MPPSARNAVSWAFTESWYGVTTATRFARSCCSALTIARAVVTTGRPVASDSMAESSASPDGPEMKPAAVQP